MKFTPTPVFVYGPDLMANSYLQDMDNQSYIGYIYIAEETPITVIPTAIDCSTDGVWPDIFVGSKKGQARFYDDRLGIADYNTPLLAENRLVTANLELWAMNGDQLAGCEPISTRSYTPAYVLHWASHQAFCAVESDDYRFICDNFHPLDHKSYLDFYRLHNGAEDAFISAFPSMVYDPMFIPPLCTTFGANRGYYIFTALSQHVPQEGEAVFFEWEWSADPTFAIGVSRVTTNGALVSTWVNDPPPGHYVYAYHRGVCGGLFDDGPVPLYFRVRRVDKVNGIPSDTSDWSSVGVGPWSISVDTRFDRNIYSGSPSFKPYWVDQDYFAGNSYASWTVTVRGYQGLQAQEPDRARLQVSSDSGFSTILYDDVGDLTFESNGYGNAWVNIPIERVVVVPRGSTYYVRCRYETSDGGTVGEWSNVFELSDGSVRIGQSNMYGSPWSYVAETHYTGDLVEWSIASEPLYVSGHTYVLLGKRRTHYAGTVRTWFGSLYLADYSGSSVTTTLIEDEVEDWHPNGWPVHNDIVAFNEKLYAGWSEPSDPYTNLYDWCEITGGIVGTVHHVARPAEAPRYNNWATMAVIHGDLRVVASLDTDPGE